MAQVLSVTPAVKAQPLPVIQRYFEVSLFLLVATGILALIATGKLDVFTTVAAAVALAYKGWGIARGRGPELTHRNATAFVLGISFSSLSTFGFSRASSPPARRILCSTPLCSPRFTC